MDAQKSLHRRVNRADGGKGGNGVGEKGKGRMWAEVGVDEKNENFTKSVRITSAKVTDIYLIFLIL